MSDESRPSINVLKFGKLEPQALNEFGLAQALGVDCQIFHGSVFSTRHVGRVSDLLSAKLRSENLDELRLRTMLLFSIFEAYEAHCQLDEIFPDGSLKVPLIIECGIDNEKLGVGIRFKVDEGEGFSVESLPERIQSGKIESVIDRLLVDLFRYCNLLVVRHEKKDKSIYLEIISLLGIPDKIDESFLAEKKAPLLVAVQTGELQPKATYTELGDLDYPTLLKEEEARQAQAPKNKEKNTKISGVTQHMLDDKQIIKGEPVDESSSDEIVIKSQIEELQKKLFVIKGGNPEDFDPSKVESNEAEEEGGAIQTIFKKLWPFRRKKIEVVQESSESEEIIEQVSATPENEEPTLDEKIEEEKKLAGNINVELTANVLMSELQNGKLDQRIQKAQKEVKSMQNEFKSDRSRKWVEGLMGDIISEKARLLDYAKKINLAVRQKEVEFKNKEFRYQEELRRKDELIRQRSVSLSRAKDQLAQSAINLERIKEASQVSTEDTHLKQKLQLSQRLLTTVKDENHQLTKKIDDLRKQVATLQMTSKTKGASMTDFTALQSKYDRTVRQLEEFKKTNQQLLEKLNDKKKQPASTNLNSAEDMKTRLDAAAKMAAAHQSQAEKLQLELDEAKHEQERLKAELEALQKKQAA